MFVFAKPRVQFVKNSVIIKDGDLGTQGGSSPSKS